MAFLPFFSPSRREFFFTPVQLTYSSFLPFSPPPALGFFLWGVFIDAQSVLCALLGNPSYLFVLYSSYRPDIATPFFFHCFFARGCKGRPVFAALDPGPYFSCAGSFVRPCLAEIARVPHLLGPTLAVLAFLLSIYHVMDVYMASKYSCGNVGG